MKPYPSQVRDRSLRCYCGHPVSDHCNDGECITGGVAGDGVSFVCGCVRFVPVDGWPASEWPDAPAGQRAVS